MAKGGKKDKWLFLIGVGKCLKGILLLFVAVGALKLLHKDAASVLTYWIQSIHVDPNGHYLARLIAKVGTIQEHKKLLLTGGTFLYSGLFLTEGTGLLLQQHWAEYFTLVITGSFIPLEIYELTKQFTTVRLVIIVLNVAVVAYLIWKLRHEAQKADTYAGNPQCV